MSARYLIRLDDACATMDKGRWQRLEAVLDRHQIKPIVAVVPDNQDPKLVVEAPDEGFWAKVQAWAAKGWTIAMHGYRHVMHQTTAPLVVPLYERSEFAGLALETQAAKIRASWSLFRDRGITPTVWVAPAHSFDLVTLEALRLETSIGIVSDGIAWDAYYEHGFHWIPQQLWGMRPRPSGLWTVCLHPNTISDAAIARFDEAVGGEFRGRIACLDQVVLGRKRRTIADRLYRHYFWYQWKRERARGGYR